MNEISITLSGWELWLLMGLFGLHVISSCLGAYLNHLKLKIEKLK